MKSCLKIKWRRWILLPAILSVSASALSQSNPGPPDRTVYIGQSGWHTGFVVRIEDAKNCWSEAGEYSGYKWLDVSWGDKDYFTAPKGTILLALRAALLPTESVLLVTPFNKSPEDFYGQSSTLARISMDEESFQALCRFISASFQRKDGGLIPVDGKGFFLAERKYCLFRTCNTWAAMGLKAAGFNVRTFPVVAAWQLFQQAEKIETMEYVE